MVHRSLCGPGEGANLGKAWSKATVQGDPGPLSWRGRREPGTQAKPMPKLPLMPTHTTCQGLGAGPEHGLGWGPAQLGRLRAGQNWLVQERLDPSPGIFPAWCPGLRSAH